MSANIRRVLTGRLNLLTGYFDRTQPIIVRADAGEVLTPDDVAELRTCRRLMQDMIPKVNEKEVAWTNLIAGLPGAVGGPQAEEQLVYDNYQAGGMHFTLLMDAAGERVTQIDIVLDGIDGNRTHTGSSRSSRTGTQALRPDAQALVEAAVRGAMAAGANNAGGRPPKGRNLRKLAPPEFDGDPLKWPGFQQGFEASVENQDLTDQEKLLHLLASLKGKAARAVKHYRATNENYPVVMEVLRKRFGNPEVVANAFEAELENLPKAGESADSLRETAEAIGRICEEFTALGKDEDSLLLRARAKIPLAVLLKLIERENAWKKMPGNVGSKWSMEEFRTALDEHIEVGEEGKRQAGLLKSSAPMLSQHSEEQESKPRNFRDRRQRDGRAFATIAQVEQDESEDRRQPDTIRNKGEREPLPCLFCGGIHWMEDCKRVTRRDERMKKLSELDRCFRCIRKGHQARECYRSNVKCRICAGEHHQVLCTGPGQKGAERSGGNRAENGGRDRGGGAHFGENSRSVTTAGVGARGDDQAYLMTLKTKMTESSSTGLLFFDPGANVPLVKHAFAKAIGAKRLGRETLNVYHFGSQLPTRLDTVKYLIKMTGPDGNLEEVKAYAKDHLPLLESVTVEGPHWKSGDEVKKSVAVEPDIVIGVHDFWRFFKSKKETSPNAYVIETTLGDVLCGKWQIDAWSGSHNHAAVGYCTITGPRKVMLWDSELRKMVNVRVDRLHGDMPVQTIEEADQATNPTVTREPRKHGTRAEIFFLGDGGLDTVPRKLQKSGMERQVQGAINSASAASSRPVRTLSVAYSDRMAPAVIGWRPQGQRARSRIGEPYMELKMSDGRIGSTPVNKVETIGGGDGGNEDLTFHTSAEVSADNSLTDSDGIVTKTSRNEPVTEPQERTCRMGTRALAKGALGALALLTMVTLAVAERCKIERTSYGVRVVSEPVRGNPAVRGYRLLARVAMALVIIIFGVRGFLAKPTREATLVMTFAKSNLVRTHSPMAMTFAKSNLVRTHSPMAMTFAKPNLVRTYSPEAMTFAKPNLAHAHSSVAMIFARPKTRGPHFPRVKKMDTPLCQGATSSLHYFKKEGNGKAKSFFNWESFISQAFALAFHQIQLVLMDDNRDPENSGEIERGGMDLGLECVVCNERFTERVRAPKTLICGHTFCQQCLVRGSEARGTRRSIGCGVCREVTPSCPLRLGTNVSLLRALELLNLVDPEPEEQAAEVLADAEEYDGAPLVEWDSDEDSMPGDDSHEEIGRERARGDTENLRQINSEGRHRNSSRGNGDRVVDLVELLERAGTLAEDARVELLERTGTEDARLELAERAGTLIEDARAARSQAVQRASPADEVRLERARVRAVEACVALERGITQGHRRGDAEVEYTAGRVFVDYGSTSSRARVPRHALPRLPASGARRGTPQARGWDRPFSRDSLEREIVEATPRGRQGDRPEQPDHPPRSRDSLPTALPPHGGRRSRRHLEGRLVLAEMQAGARAIDGGRRDIQAPLDRSSEVESTSFVTAPNRGDRGGGSRGHRRGRRFGAQHFMLIVSGLWMLSCGLLTTGELRCDQTADQFGCRLFGFGSQAELRWATTEKMHFDDGAKIFTGGGLLELGATTHALSTTRTPTTGRLPTAGYRPTAGRRPITGRRSAASAAETPKWLLTMTQCIALSKGPVEKDWFGRRGVNSDLCTSANSLAFCAAYNMERWAEKSFPPPPFYSDHSTLRAQFSLRSIDLIIVAISGEISKLLNKSKMAAKGKNVATLIESYLEHFESGSWEADPTSHGAKIYWKDRLRKLVGTNRPAVEMARSDYLQQVAMARKNRKNSVIPSERAVLLDRLLAEPGTSVQSGQGGVLKPLEVKVGQKEKKKAEKGNELTEKAGESHGNKKRKTDADRVVELEAQLQLAREQIAEKAAASGKSAGTSKAAAGAGPDEAGTGESGTLTDRLQLMMGLFANPTKVGEWVREVHVGEEALEEKTAPADGEGRESVAVVFSGQKDGTEESSAENREAARDEVSLSAGEVDDGARSPVPNPDAGVAPACPRGRSAVDQARRSIRRAKRSVKEGFKSLRRADQDLQRAMEMFDSAQSALERAGDQLDDDVVSLVGSVAAKDHGSGEGHDER